MELLAGAGDSKHYRLHADQVIDDDSSPETINPVSSLKAAGMVLRQAGCNLPLAAPKITCVKAVKYIPALCYIEPKNIGGYFLVTKDYVDGVNVIFSRWD